MHDSIGDLEETLATADRVTALKAMRELLAQAMVGADDKALPALTKQMTDVLRQLDALEPVKERTTRDDIAAARAARRAGAALPQRSTGT